MNITIPQKFKDRYTKLVDDPNNFFNILSKPLQKSFRVNTLKSSINEIRERFNIYGINIKQVPWYSDAFISESLAVGVTLEYFLGHIYIQELTSMLPPLLIIKELQNAKIVLDGCAAPGSKTTQLADFMKNQGTIIANELDYARLYILKFNLERIGVINTILTRYDMRFFPNELEFDVILVDVPCSGEGTIRRDPKALSNWSENRILRYVGIQKQIILKAFDLLKPGGHIVYSTCTFAPEENENVVDFLLNKRPAKIEKINIPKIKLTPGIQEWNGKTFNSDIKKTVRIWPHHNDTNGFFLAKIKK